MCELGDNSKVPSLPPFFFFCGQFGVQPKQWRFVAKTHFGLQRQKEKVGEMMKKGQRRGEERKGKERRDGRMERRNKEQNTQTKETETRLQHPFNWKWQQSEQA